MPASRKQRAAGTIHLTTPRMADMIIISDGIVKEMKKNR